MLGFLEFLLFNPDIQRSIKCTPSFKEPLQKGDFYLQNDGGSSYEENFSTLHVQIFAIFPLATRSPSNHLQKERT